MIRVGFVELMLVAVGLSMDACAVAICKGLAMPRLNIRHALVIALFFGGFQALMPLIGYVLGAQFQTLIAPIDHWIAFVLLVFIGGKMLVDAFRDDGGQEDPHADGVAQKLDYKELTLMAIATSIDALAVGITLALLNVDIIASVSAIGVTTFALSLVGVALGHAFGSRFERPATILGGVVLILIGAKILVEHLGLL